MGGFLLERKVRCHRVIIPWEQVCSKLRIVVRKSNSPRTETGMETSAQESLAGAAKSSRAQGIRFRYWRARIRLRGLRKRLLEALCKCRYVFRSLVGHSRTLLARKNLRLDYGPAMQSLPDGCLVPNEKTIARSQSIQNLRATYTGWVGVVEAEMFLMGFEAGAEWRARTGLSQ
jgi:hypothetical protein